MAACARVAGPEYAALRLVDFGRFRVYDLAGSCAISAEARELVDWGCSGFAGDRGILQAELTASAIEREAAETGARRVHPPLS